MQEYRSFEAFKTFFTGRMKSVVMFYFLHCDWAIALHKVLEGRRSSVGPHIQYALPYIREECESSDSGHLFLSEAPLQCYTTLGVLAFKFQLLHC